MRKHIISFLAVLTLNRSMLAGLGDFFGICGNPCGNCKKDTNLAVSKLDQFREELRTAKVEVTFNCTRELTASFLSETSGDNEIKFFWKMQIQEPGEDERLEKIIKIMQPTDPVYQSSDFKGLGVCDPDLRFQVPLRNFFPCLSEEGSQFYVVFPQTDSSMTNFRINLCGFCFIHRTHDQALFFKNLSDFSVEACRELRKHFACIDPDSSPKDIQDKKRALKKRAMEHWLCEFFRDFVPSTYVSEVRIAEGLMHSVRD